MRRTQIKVILLFIFPVIIISLYSCSPSKHMIKTANKLHDTVLGRWFIERRPDATETSLSRSIGLNRGIIIFYPNGNFMYQNKTKRQTSTWHIDAEIARESEYWILDIQVPEQVYPAYKVFLKFNDKRGNENQADARFFYIANKKLKVKSELYGCTIVNVLKRK